MKRFTWKQFVADQSGSILVLVGLSVLVLVAIAGSGYDLGRQQLVRQKIQQASDQGALAGALMPNGTSDADRRTTATRYFNLNYPTTYLGVARPTPQVNVSSTDVQVTLATPASVPTSFISNVGIASMNATGSSTVQLSATASSDYDVVVVVDESGSQAAPLPPFSSRMEAQKSALRIMADTIVPVGTTNANVRMGFLGFSSFISNKWGLSNQNTHAKTAINNMRPIYQNFDHTGMLVGRQMLLGGQGAPNGQINAPYPYNPQVNITTPNPRTARTAPSDANGVSPVKFVVFLSDGGIMIEPMGIHGGYIGEDNFDPTGLVQSNCPSRGFWNGSNECFAAFVDACTQLRNTGGSDNVHVFIINLASPVTAPQIGALTTCASPTIAGGPTYSPTVKPNAGKDFYFAADAATLQSLLTNITKTIQKVRITQ